MKNDKYSPKDDTNKAKQSHEIFVEKNLKFTEGMTSDIVVAYRNFMIKWNPENETANESLLKIKKDFSKAKFMFALDGHPGIKLHDMDGEIARKVEKDGPGLDEKEK